MGMSIGRFITAKFDGQITLNYMESEETPFDHSVIANQLIDKASWIKECIGIGIVYGGVTDKLNEQNTITVVYVPEEEMVEPWHWAYTSRQVDSIDINSVVIKCNPAGCNSPEKFAGIVPTHELFHALGFEHWNESPLVSIMNDSPYLGYTEQGVVLAEDLWTFGMKYPGIPKGHPSVYDFGEEGRMIIYIPALRVGPMNFELWLTVKHEGLKTFLEVTKYGTPTKPLTPVCTWGAGDILTMPLIYRGVKATVQATWVQNTTKLEITSVV